MFTMQEVFTKTYNFIMEQGPSFEAGECVYRGPYGVKCAAGMWISDEDYKPDFEGTTASFHPVVRLLPPIAGLTREQAGVFFDSLQIAHDTAATESYRPFSEGYKEWMEKLAEQFELEMPT